MANIKTTKADKSLFKICSFWFVFLSPMVLGLFVGICISIVNDLEFDLAIESLAFALDAFELPLLIASMSFPITALFVYNHRSRQTRHQIENSNTQLIASLTPELIINDCFNGSTRVIKLINIGMATAKLEGVSYETQSGSLTEREFFSRFPESYDGEKVALILLKDVGFLSKDSSKPFIEYEFKNSGLTIYNYFPINDLLAGTELIIKYKSMLSSDKPFELRHTFNALLL